MTNLKEILKKQEEEFYTRFPSRRSEIFNDSYLFEHDPDPRDLKAWHNIATTKAVIEALDAIVEEVIGENQGYLEEGPGIDSEDIEKFDRLINHRNDLRKEMKARYTTLKKELENG